VPANLLQFRRHGPVGLRRVIIEYVAFGAAMSGALVRDVLEGCMICQAALGIGNS
jgi:hypothetical protein